MAVAAVVSSIAFSPLSSSGAAVGYTAESSSADRNLGELERAAPETCQWARAGLAFYRSRQADWLKLRGVGRAGFAQAPTRLSPRKPRSCPDARYLAQVAKRRSFAARQAYERWVERHTLEDFHVGSSANAWRRAVREVQRAYPGTEALLLSCSASEGGWGRWVPNSQGSGVGGWMQFMPGTFWRMFAAAKADVEARGFRVPSSYASWFSPGGQALAGAWGMLHRRHEWAGHGC